EYCQSWMRNAIHPFNIDHIISEKEGGDDDPENLALSCGGDNNNKGDKIAALDPVTKEIVPLYHPRKDKWTDLFAWSEDFLEMIGLTPSGRATIKLLKLNREGLRNMRRLTVASGEHPPLIND
ncbi:MAG: HNH endonuclease signature motif containing protein, partial [Bacteroidota bacterium]